MVILLPILIFLLKGRKINRYNKGEYRLGKEEDDESEGYFT